MCSSASTVREANGGGEGDSSDAPSKGPLATLGMRLLEGGRGGWWEVVIFTVPRACTRDRCGKTFFEDDDACDDEGQDEWGYRAKAVADGGCWRWGWRAEVIASSRAGSSLLRVASGPAPARRRQRRSELRRTVKSSSNERDAILGCCLTLEYYVGRAFHCAEASMSKSLQEFNARDRPCVLCEERCLGACELHRSGAAVVSTRESCQGSWLSKGEVS